MTTFYSKNIYVYLFFVILFYSIFVNIININITEDSSDGRYSHELVHDSTRWSIDNPWYTTQIKNYVSGDGFTIDGSDPGASVRRTPGYPLFYGFHYILFGEETAHRILPYSQSIIFSLSAVAFGLIVSLITKSNVLGYILTLLYGTSLYFTGYLFYTITESIHPSLVVFSLYYASRFFFSDGKFSYNYLILATIFCAFATLTRPLDGVLLVALTLAILLNKHLDILRRLQFVFLSIFVFSIIFSPWIIHNYIKINKFVPLETSNQSAAFGGFGSKSVALNDWWSSWGSPNGTALHVAITTDIGTDDPYLTIRHFISKTVPEYAYVGYSKEELYSALISYQDCINYRITKYKNKITQTNLEAARKLWGHETQVIDLMKIKWGEKPLECEANVYAKFNEFKHKIKQGDPLRYYVIVPIFIRAPQYIFHSYTNSFASLNPIDKKFNIIQYVVKAFFYVMNILLWSFSFVYLFLQRASYEKVLFGSFFLITFIYLIYFMHVETRYMLGVYPSMYIMSTITLMTFTKRIRSYLRMREK